MFFFEKKNQKTFANLGGASPQHAGKLSGCAARIFAGRRNAYFSAAVLSTCFVALSTPDVLAQPEPERLQEAKRLYADMGGEGLFAPYFARIEKNLVESMAIWSGRAAKDVQGAVETIIMPDVRASNHMAEHYVEEMAESFTLEELKQIDAFEATSVGQKLRDRRPAIATHIYDEEYAWAKTIWPSLFEKHKADLAAAGVTRKTPSP